MLLFEANGSLAASPQSGEKGVVETVSGPGFCPGGSTQNRATEVTNLAVEATGRLFFETGPRSSGTVARIEADSRAATFSTGTPRGPDLEPNKSLTDGPPSAGRIAPNGKGGIFVAAGTKISEIDSTNSLASVIGDANAVLGIDGVVSSGDGGPAAKARFTNVRSLTTDEQGNLYVAERINLKGLAVRIRVINRGSETLVFYGGTPLQITIAPGSIQTIAGIAGNTNAGDGGPASKATIAGVPPSLAVNSGRLYVAVYSLNRNRATTVVRMINLTGTSTKAHSVKTEPGFVETVAGKGASGFSGDGGRARSARFSYLPGISADDKGNLFVADEWNHRIRKIDPKGIVSTFAGPAGTTKRQGGFNGNQRRAVTALLNRPFDVKVGLSGVYLSDRLNSQVRIVDQAGTIRAAPGSGVAGLVTCTSRSNRSTGTHPKPERATPYNLETDSKGNAFFTLQEHNQIKRISASGQMSTVAGKMPNYCDSDCKLFGGDGKQFAGASFDKPSALTVDANDNIYVLDSGNARVRFINLGKTVVKANGVTVKPGTIQTVAGNGRAEPPRNYGRGISPTPVGGKALQEEIGGVGSLAVDARGNLFLGAWYEGRVLQIDPSGAISTFAGRGAKTPLEGCCTEPQGLTMDANGNLYVSDDGRDSSPLRNLSPRVWFVNRGGKSIVLRGVRVPPLTPVVVAGNGQVGYAGNGGPAPQAELLPPRGLALDPKGNLYISGAGQAGDVKRVDLAGTIHVLAGSGVSGFNGDGQRPQLTSVSPSDLAVDRCGNVLVADVNRVRRINLVGACRRSDTATERNNVSPR